MSRLAAAVVSVVALFPACSGGGTAVTDSEVDAIKTTRANLTTADEFATPGVVHVRLAWGLLAWAGKGEKPTAVDWTGGATLSDGSATLDMTTFFEKGDEPVSGETNQVKWKSHTLPHFDGIIATLKPGSDASTLTIATPGFERTLPISELKGEQRFVVGEKGHEFSISALPDEDASCSGFIVGFSRDTNFKGLMLSNLGDRVGKLRFDVNEGKIVAELFDLNGELIDAGEGTLDTATRTFLITLGKRTVSGLYADPSYSTRGSFQATARCL